MKLQMQNSIRIEIINAEEARRFFGNLVMSENCCCLCCCNDTGGGLFCS